MNCYLIEFNERPCLTFAVICMPQASPSLNLTRPLNSDMNLMYFNLQLLHHILFHQFITVFAYMRFYYLVDLSESFFLLFQLLFAKN